MRNAAVCVCRQPGVSFCHIFNNPYPVFLLSFVTKMCSVLRDLICLQFKYKQMYNCLQALLERTGYTLDVTTGQRKYGGPPPDSVYSGVQPGIGTEVSILQLFAEIFPVCKLFYSIMGKNTGFFSKCSYNYSFWISICILLSS